MVNWGLNKWILQKKQTKRDNSLGATVSDIGAMVISKMHEINTSEVIDGQDISMDQMECLNKSRVKNPELTLEPSFNAQILQNPDWPNSNTNNTEETYSAYISGVFDGEFTFNPLTSAIFVVAGWNEWTLMCNVSHPWLESNVPDWFFRITGITYKWLESLTVVCMCPTAKAKIDGIGLDCVHTQFILDFINIKFPPGENLDPICKWCQNEFRGRQLN